MRYRLKLATWIVAREPDQPSPLILSSPDSVTLLALDLVRAADDDIVGPADLSLGLLWDLIDDFGKTGDGKWAAVVADGGDATR